jgi:hypothetical protein
MELPMACTLDRTGMREQGERYRRLGAAVERLERGEAELVVEFGAPVDEALLGEAIAVERGCCEFFGFDWDGDARRLRVSVAQAEHGPALEMLERALAAGRA